MLDNFYFFVIISMLDVLKINIEILGKMIVFF